MRKVLISAIFALAATGAAASASAVEFKTGALLQVQPAKMASIRSEIEGPDSKLEARIKVAPASASETSADADDRDNSEDSDVSQPTETSEEATKQTTSQVGGTEEPSAAPA